MDLQNVGRLVIVAGVALIVLGGVFLLLGRFGFGNLPGDIRVQSGSLTCFAPITTMIVLSVILTIVLNIVIRLMNR